MFPLKYDENSRLYYPDNTDDYSNYDKKTLELNNYKNLFLYCENDTIFKMRSVPVEIRFDKYFYNHEQSTQNPYLSLSKEKYIDAIILKNDTLFKRHNIILGEKISYKTKANKDSGLEKFIVIYSKNDNILQRQYYSEKGTKYDNEVFVFDNLGRIVLKINRKLKNLNELLNDFVFGIEDFTSFSYDENDNLIKIISKLKEETKSNREEKIKVVNGRVVTTVTGGNYKIVKANIYEFKYENDKIIKYIESTTDNLKINGDYSKIDLKLSYKTSKIENSISFNYKFFKEGDINYIFTPLIDENQKYVTESWYIAKISNSFPMEYKKLLDEYIETQKINFITNTGIEARNHLSDYINKKELYTEENLKLLEKLDNNNRYRLYTKIIDYLENDSEFLNSTQFLRDKNLKELEECLKNNSFCLYLNRSFLDDYKIKQAKMYDLFKSKLNAILEDYGKRLSGFEENKKIEIKNKKTSNTLKSIISVGTELLKKN